ncbi:hypothetical protein ABN764_05520 [Paenibacillaceae sp. P-4]|uniref:hypothetical protein n=1 Tax=Paenibacillaceae bacterium P-4 TaxID=3160969 RepID=UPI0032E84028
MQELNSFHVDLLYITIGTGGFVTGIQKNLNLGNVKRHFPQSSSDDLSGNALGMTFCHPILSGQMGFQVTT